MNEKKYSYQDPYFLNRLIMYFSAQQCSLSATLHPDIEEFIDLAQKKPHWDYSYLHQGHPAATTLRIWKDYFLTMSTLCQQHMILPFWSLVFDYDYRQFEEPKIIYQGFSHDGTIHGEPRKSLVHPALFAQPNHKWYSISFDKAKGKESVERVQQAAAGFIAQGYRVTSINAHLNPKTESRGTCEESYDTEFYDASLSAQGKEIIIQGDAGIDFDDIHNLQQKKLPTLGLLGENLEKILGK